MFSRPGVSAAALPRQAHHDSQGEGLASGRRYLEGLKLTFHLLGEALAMLTKLALPGGLSNGVLQPSFQLQEEGPLLTGTKPALRTGALGQRSSYSL